MHAIRVTRFGGPDVLQLANVPDPTPNPGEVMIRVHAVGVNPVETYLRSGQYTPLPELPFTPGSDAAGVVESVGAGVSRFQPGDRVYTHGSRTGSYAERTVARIAQVEPLPDGVSFAQGAALGIPYATAHRALFGRARLQPQEFVLIHGASGGVGLAAIQLAAAFGARVAGTAGTNAGAEHVAAAGAERVMNHHQPDYLEAIREWTNGHGVDVIIEMLANVNLGWDLTLLARSGRVIVVGSRGPVEINARELMTRDAEVRGMILGQATPTELSLIHESLRVGLDNGCLRPVIGDTLPLGAAAEAHVRVMAAGKRGKIVLIP